MLEVVCALIFFMYVIAFVLLHKIRKLEADVNDIYMYLMSEIPEVEEKPVIIKTDGSGVLRFVNEQEEVDDGEELEEYKAQKRYFH